jgi:hypothetical protein
MHKHGYIMNKTLLPSLKGWSLILENFVISLLPYVPTGKDHNLHKNGLAKPTLALAADA